VNHLAQIAPWLEDIGKLAGILVAFGAAVTMLYRGAKASRTALTDTIKAEMQQQLLPLHLTVEHIKDELSYNGGGSVKDMTKANGDAIAEVRAAAGEAAALAKGVALALEASHIRADAVPPSAPAGEAADAASQTG
jgi:hypothetical protein